MKTITLLVLFATGCFHEVDPPAPVPTATGTLTGVVHFVGMQCQQPGPGCDGPMADYEVTILAKDGTTVVAKTKTDPTGVYTLALPAGDYTILTAAGIYPTDRRRNDATVTIGNTTKLDLTEDTGVR